MLHVQHLQLELICNHLCFLMPRIARSGRHLADQVRPAANSIGLNTDEGLDARDSSPGYLSPNV